MNTYTSTIPYCRKDSAFDALYPQHIRDLSSIHWTAIDVALKASDFLATSGARILDIGSGVGKFCIIAAAHHPNAQFFGIEQRKDLFNYAKTAKKQVGVENAHFSFGNLTTLNYENYDSFYFYNSFYENIESDNRIDYSVKTSFELYNQYTEFIYNILNGRSSGTRLATYHAPNKQIPSNYKLVDNAYSNVLKMWIKE
ncbi:methyltransferase domain-containing protein [Pedobacter sp. UYEF25]